MNEQTFCCLDSTVHFFFICYSIILKLTETLLHQKLTRKFQDLSLQFSHSNSDWNFYQSTNQVFSTFKSTEIERADSASIIMLWFFLFFQKRTLFFSDLLIYLFLIFCEFLNIWHSESWHVLMSFYSAHRSSWRRESLTSFSCAEKLSALSCLISAELQWSFKPWTVSYVVQALCKLTSMFLFSFKEVFWLLIMSFICKEASFLWDFVICLTCFLCLRFMTEFNQQVEIWNELQQQEKFDDFVLFSRAFFWWLCMLSQFDMSCHFSSFSSALAWQLSSDENSERECMLQLSLW